MTNIYPVPEAADPGAHPWVVRQPVHGSQGQSDLRSHIIEVPLADDPYAEAVRSHELLHVKYTPAIDPQETAREAGVGVDVLNAVEDLRIHALSAGLKLPIHTVGTDTPERNAAMIQRIQEDRRLTAAQKERQFSLLNVGTFQTADNGSIRNAIARIAPAAWKTAHRANDLAYNALADNGWTFQGTIEAARTVERLMRESEMQRQAEQAQQQAQQRVQGQAQAPNTQPGGAPQPPQPPQSDSWRRHEQKPHSGSQLGQEAEAAARANLIQSIYGNKPARKVGRSPKGWGKMIIEEPPRPHRSTGHIMGRGARPHEEGTDPRYMHRYAIDGHIWGRIGRHYGGTVVIDASGSMKMHPNEVIQLVTAAPGALVAVYTGMSPEYSLKASEGQRYGLEVGVLRILAYRGHTCDSALMAQPYGVENVIDGPVLQWLGKQKRPRIWVSDGLVTGTDGHNWQDLIEDAQEICMQHTILRIPMVAQAIEHLNDLRRRGMPVLV